MTAVRFVAVAEPVPKSDPTVTPMDSIRLGWSVIRPMAGLSESSPRQWLAQSARNLIGGRRALADQPRRRPRAAITAIPSNAAAPGAGTGTVVTAPAHDPLNTAVLCAESENVIR